MPPSPSAIGARKKSRAEKGKRVRFGTNFDVIPIKSDGHFLTELMPPGEYDFRLFAVRETTPEAAIQSSEFEGQAKITISGKAGTQKLDIVAAPPGTRRAKRKGAGRERPSRPSRRTNCGKSRKASLRCALCYRVSPRLGLNCIGPRVDRLANGLRGESARARVCSRRRKSC